MESVQSGFVKWLLAKIAAAHRLTCFVKKTSVSLSLAEPSSYTVKLAQWTMNHSLAPLHQTFYLKRPFQKLTLQAAHKVKRDTHFFFFFLGGFYVHSCERFVTGLVRCPQKSWGLIFWGSWISHTVPKIQKKHQSFQQMAKNDIAVVIREQRRK